MKEFYNSFTVNFDSHTGLFNSLGQARTPLFSKGGLVEEIYYMLHILIKVQYSPVLCSLTL